ncbi:M48 family metalloprotease [Nocardia arizonensis]|uniref:M48 family metalloprotease n=1 Tax=Nocardia arizonensis TaxID=1141647 RepID=UPI0006D0A013|nr:M48 family metalloprotease [Nocardia arizonensis]
MHVDISDGPAPVPRRLRVTTALITLAVSLPSMTLGGLLVFGFGTLLGPRTALGLTVIWLFGGAFLPPPAGGAAPWIFPVRRPRPAEQGVLSAAWHNVARAAGIRAEDYSLWVEDIDQLNALAAPGRIVVVTSAAIDLLGPRELEAILAHELGHHLGGGQRAWMLAYWYALPITALWRILRRITWYSAVFIAQAAHIVGLAGALRMFGVRKPMDAIGFTAAVFMRVSLLIAAAVFAVLHFGAVLVALLATLVLEPFAERAQRRRGEIDADRVAVDLGYGRELRAVLDMWTRRVDPPKRFAGLLDSHPRLPARIAAVENRMGGADSV